MKVGNISQTVWKRSILKQLNSTRNEVLFAPSMEEPCTALRTLDGSAVIYTSAVASGNAREVGIYAAAKAINDIAARGAEPISVSVQVILPPSVSEAYLKSMIGYIESICKEARVQLACVKAEVNPAVGQSIVTAMAAGAVKESHIIRSEQAAAGQDIILCGYAGLEGMLRILAEREKELGKRFVPVFIKQMKALKENILGLGAIAAAQEAGAAAIHQIGSGGIFAALWELAEASGIGMEVELSKISVRQETVEVCEYYNLNPYQMTSTGSFLITAENGDALVKALEGVGARASKLGVATDGNARVITSGEEQRYLDRPAPDELMLWWERTFQEACMKGNVQ